MADWILARDTVHAIRDARAAISMAAGTGSQSMLEHAILAAVHAMRSADFARATICSLVAAALDTGLPRRRNYLTRSDDVRFWTARAASIVDALDETAGA